jgi:2-keto-4-pentenoate hydratase/2-oxohepta-3-ene-1,7-dioic acid hydratase in catechol pathway
MSCWVRYRTTNGRAAFGTLEDQRIAVHTGELFDAPAATGETVWLEQVELLPPCVPSKIVALWNNFHALAEKLQKSEPAHPLFLLKPASSLAGPGQTIERPAAYRGKIAFEGELGIVIGRRCKDASPAEAERCIFGYTCVNDVTAAEVLNEDSNFPQWARAKGYDTFGCIGPAIARDFDWSGARVVTRLDGVERQNYPLSDMIFPPAEQVSRISHDMTLLPGDVIACGTSLGVGSMKDGSIVEIEIDGIGSLVNTLAA